MFGTLTPKYTFKCATLFDVKLIRIYKTHLQTHITGILETQNCFHQQVEITVFRLTLKLM